MPDKWSQDQVKRSIKQYQLKGPVLDVGAGQFVSWFKPMFQEAGIEYVAMDQQNFPGIDIVAKAAHCTQFSKYSTVMCLSVLEHCENPFEVIDFCRRHLVSGGHLLIAAPCCWPHHQHPADYWRILPDGARLLMRGMDIKEVILEVTRLDTKNQLFGVGGQP